jgi:hypothetical protein
MAKSIVFSIIILFISGCVRLDLPRTEAVINIEQNIVEEPIEEKPQIVVPKPEPIVEEPTKKECVDELTNSFVGTYEIGGNNKDFNNSFLKELLIKSNWKTGQAWCSFIVKGVLDHCEVPNTVTGWSPSSYNRKDVIYTDGKFQKEYKNEDILIMSLSYQKFRNDKTRFKGIGHTGFVESIGTQSVTTKEGNTSQQPDNINADRNGDGFHRRIRPLTNNLHITRWGNEK